ncbi:MAG: DUF2334 domain-containing protein [Mycobacteriaceae bacterium]
MATVIVSLSGIRTENLDAAGEFATELDRRGVPLSLLVAPRMRNGRWLANDAATLQWLRLRSAGGDAIVLHGYDQSPDQLLGRHRRAEFATLAEHEATLRLTAADRVLESVDLRTRLFAPPRWLASSGAVAALSRTGFQVCAELGGVRDLATGAVQPGRVLGVGAGRKAEPWWCRAVVLGAGRSARRGGLVRLSIAAKQLRNAGPHQAMLDALDLALHHGAVPQCYSAPRKDAA